MIYEREHFLSREECEELLALFPRFEAGRVEHGSKVHRRSHVTFIPNKLPVVEKLYRAIVDVNARIYKFDVNGHELLQLAEYREGDAYDWHTDLGPNSAVYRKLSASIQLSDPSTYDGGDLEFWGGKPVSREQGALIMFPAYTLHRVTPVTRGLRRSLVAWSTGLRSFR